jgi:Ca2+-binding EF-hand superfamily protein
MLSSLLSRLDTTSASSTSTTSDDTGSGSTTPVSGSDTSLTGPNKPSLSSVILGTLIGMQQQQSGGGTSQTGDPSSSDAVQSLFTAMDSDSDGSVSQSELEGYIEQQGRTQNQADQLYSMLDSSGDSGISESTLQSDAPQGPPPGGPPPGGPPPGGPPPGGMGGGHHLGMHGAHSASDAASTLLQTMDSDSDGGVSQGEFESFVTSNGGTTAEADSDFAALDSSGSGSLSASDFEKAIEHQQQSNSGSTNGSPPSILAFLNTVAGNNSAGSTVSLSA